MKVCACLLLYNGEDMVHRGLLRQLEWFDDFIIGYATRPWNKEECGYRDGVFKKINNAWLHFDVFSLNEDTEAGSRNSMIDTAARRGNTHCFFIDEDEIWTKVGVTSFVNQWNGGIAGLSGQSVKTMWDGGDQEVWPRPDHYPIVGVPVTERFEFARDFGNRHDQIITLPLGVTMDHYSWVRPYKVLKEKLECYSHSDQVREGWLEDTVLAGKVSREHPFAFEGLRPIDKEKAALWDITRVQDYDTDAGLREAKEIARRTLGDR